MTRLLAIDTASDACSVALLSHGQVFELHQATPRSHIHHILPLIEQLLKEAHMSLSEVDVLAFGCGPGSFTGVRIAASVIQGLAFALDKPVVPVSSLQALAQTANRLFGVTQACVAVDAHMDELFWGVYALQANDVTGLMHCVIPDSLVTPGKIKFPEVKLFSKDWVGVGSGWDRYQKVLLDQSQGRVIQAHSHCIAHAQDIARLALDLYQQGKMVDAAHALPVYLRGKEAWKG